MCLCNTLSWTWCTCISILVPAAHKQNALLPILEEQGLQRLTDLSRPHSRGILGYGRWLSILIPWRVLVHSFCITYWRKRPQVLRPKIIRPGTLITATYPLTFWRRNYFLILAHPVYKILIIQEPNTLELRNKLHFEEKETESIYHV